MKQVFGIILMLSFALSNAQQNPCAGIWNGNVPDPQNCSLYFSCLLTVPTQRSCEPNKVFSTISHSCVPGDPETCEVFTITTPIDTTTELEDTSETTENELDTTTSPELTTDLSTIQPTTTSRLSTTTPIPIHRCPPGGNGYIPHHTNCNRYFECINGIRQMRFCPDGLLFDSVTLHCTYPEFAVCAGVH